MISTVQQSAPAGIWRILFVDDDEDEHLLLADMLDQAARLKFSLKAVFTLQSGWDCLQRDHYTAALIDYNLGPDSGIDLIGRVSAAGDPTPLILFTSRGNPDVDQEAIQAGATLYLVKKETTPLLLERMIRYAVFSKQNEIALKQANARLIELKDALELDHEAAILPRPRRQDGYPATANLFALLAAQLQLLRNQSHRLQELTRRMRRK